MAACGRCAILAAVSLIAAGCFSTESAADHPAEPPNIVLVLADDLGYAQLSSSGSDFYRTPHIDAIGKEGMRFTSAYTSAAVCSPTRAAIMTGLHPARLRLTDYIPGSRREHPMRSPDWQKYLSLDAHTIAELARESGYRTGFFGKWHLAKSKTPPQSLSHNPDRQGFEQSLVTQRPQNDDLLPEHALPGRDNHHVDAISAAAIEFLRRHRNERFFVMLSHHSIHTPLIEETSAVTRFAAHANADNASSNPIIGAMLERLDDSVGRLLQTLDELELDRQTMVIFYSDNGGLERVAAQSPFRAGKGWLYEGGIRVPLMIRWPGVIAAGSVTDQVVSSVDIYPTFAELFGRNSVGTDGTSWLPLLRNGEQPQSRELFWHYPHYHATGMRPASAIRAGKFKLIEWLENGRIELYDLSSDIGEQDDLSQAMPEKAANLAEKLRHWRTAVGAQMPVARQ